MLPPKNERNNDTSALDSIEHQLYNPKVKEGVLEMHHTKNRRTVDLPTSWGEDAPILVKRDAEKGFSFGAKLLLVSTVFLIIALSFAAWRVMSLRNVVSASNIDMTADITPFIEGGEVTPLILTLHNRNVAQLLEARITLLYKQGNGSQDEQEKVQEKREIGTINSGDFKKQDFKVSLYGSESESRDIVLKLEYKVAGSNATFSKLVTAQVVLRAPPISVTIEGDDKLSIGQSGTYSFVIKNNSATSSLPSVLQLTLPNSFTTESASPKPLPRSTSWQIDPLASGESTKIVITGSFKGKQGEVATIEAKIGSRGDSPTLIGIVYASQSTDITLRASPLTLATSLTTDSGSSASLRYGDRATLTFTYSNTSLSPLEDVSLKVSLSGDAPLYNSINPTTGYYDSITKTITWDKATLPDLAILPPNSQGTVIVSIPIVQKGTNSPLLTAVFRGNASTKSSDDIVAFVSKTYPVLGSATLSASTQYKKSPFPNDGPIPPEPNTMTTYTVHLNVSAQNALSASKVSFVLPAYVTWRNVTSDTTTTYDSKTRTVIWNIGPLVQGASVATDIGVAVRPSQSHVGGSPPITSGIVLDADEEVSRAHLRTTLSALTTELNGEAWQGNPSVVVGK